MSKNQAKRHTKKTIQIAKTEKVEIKNINLLFETQIVKVRNS